jgi:hypothetical protein
MVFVLLWYDTSYGFQGHSHAHCEPEHAINADKTTTRPQAAHEGAETDPLTDAATNQRKRQHKGTNMIRATVISALARGQKLWRATSTSTSNGFVTKVPRAPSAEIDGQSAAKLTEETMGPLAAFSLKLTPLLGHVGGAARGTGLSFRRSTRPFGLPLHP